MMTNTKNKDRIGIIGAGISGVTAAYELAKKDIPTLPSWRSRIE